MLDRQSGRIAPHRIRALSPAQSRDHSCAQPVEIVADQQWSAAFAEVPGLACLVFSLHTLHSRRVTELGHEDSSILSGSLAIALPALGR